MVKKPEAQQQETEKPEVQQQQAKGEVNVCLRVDGQSKTLRARVVGRGPDDTLHLEITRPKQKTIRLKGVPRRPDGGWHGWFPAVARAAPMQPDRES